jgi:sulfate permease, SulP family
MTVFHRATVALSLTASDAELLRYAALLWERQMVAEFRFVHVVTPVHKPGDADLTSVATALWKMVGEVFPATGGAVEALCEVREGVRIDSLVEAVIAHESDLLLLGHRRARSGQRSLARRLAMIGPSSVWVVPEGNPARISSVLAPVDFSDHSGESLSYAAAIAKRLELGRCLGLHVYFDPSTIRYDEHIVEMRERAQLGFDEFLASVNTHGQMVESLTEESSNVGRTILRIAGERQADLIVMSTRGRSRAAAILLGSATSQVMAESPVPVLAVKQHGAHLSLFQALKDAQVWQRPSPKAN